MLFGLRAHMEANPSHILLKLDFTNAYNTMSRAAVLDACLNEPRWRKFVKFLWVTLSPASHIEGIPDLSWEGLQQGDTWGSAGFCAGLHPDVDWVSRALQPHNGMAVFDMDDGYLAAPPDAVFRLATELGERVFTRCGVRLNLSKCEAWSPTPDLVQTQLAARPGTPFKLGSVPGWSSGPGLGVLVGGIPVGDTHYIEFHVQSKVSKVLSQTDKIVSSLRDISPQNLYTLLVYCINTRVQYMSQCLHPSRTKNAFLRFDHAIATHAEDATGCTVLTRSNGLFPHDELAEFLPAARLRLPRRLNGGMLRSVSDIAPLAYLGGLLLTIPSFTDTINPDGTTTPDILRHLPPTLFGPATPNHGNALLTRFKPLLSGPSPLGKHLKSLWRTIRAQVHGLNKPQSEIDQSSLFAVSVEAAGYIRGNICTKPQHQLTLEVEERIAASLLARTLLRCTRGPTPPPYPVAAYLSVDRLSRQFVATPAGPVTTIDAASFQECWSTYLGCPSPACSPHSTKSFTDCRSIRRTVGIYGHGLCNATLHGDHFRKRHNATQHCLSSLAAWCRVGLDMEVANLFVPFLLNPQATAGTPQRILHGFVPDFRLVQSNTLADVKTISYGPAWYSGARFNGGLRQDAVRYRSDCVHRDAIAKLKRLDVQSGWISTTRPGPATKRLQSFGRVEAWVTGAFGEASPDLHKFLDLLTRKGATARHRDLGCDTPLQARAHIKRRCCRELGVAAVRAAALHKLQALATVLVGKEETSKQSQRRSAAKATHEARSNTYFNQRSFYADDLPHRRRAHDL